MPRFRNLTQITLFTLLVLGGVLLGLKLFGNQKVRAAHAVPVAANAGHRAPDTQATFTVTNASDGDAGSLRIAIGQANIAGGANTIVFDPAFFNTPRTINLTSALPVPQGNITITGPGAHLLTIRRDTGGNYRIFSINSGLTAALSGLTISNGNTGAGEGGGIFNGGTLTITGCHITGNMAATGGGISNGLGATLILTQSTISNNTATGSSTGGGIASLGPTTITNSTISGNTVTGSGGSGGGLRLSSSNGNAITSSTITNNSATGTDSAGGLRLNVAAVTLRNTIVAGNVSNATVPDVSGSGITFQNHNIIGNPGALTLGGTNNQSGTGAAPLNPLLAPLGNFGGATPVHAPLPGSPALDKGATDSPIDTDQRGALRRFDITSIAPASSGDNSDIGAVELQAVFVTNTTDNDAGSLRQAITGATALRDILFDPAVFNVPRTITLTGGEVNIGRSMTISGPGANLLTVSGNNTNRIFNITVTAGQNVAVSGLTISNGRAGGAGGVLMNSSGSCAFTACTFSGNLADGGGDGGAISLGSGSGTFTGCTFTGNTATGNRGGAVQLRNSSGTFTNCTVSGNTANFGGGIAVFNTIGNQTIAVTNCTIVNNTSFGNNGSGLLVEVAAGLTTTATLRNSIVANNSGPENVKGFLGGVASPATIISQGFNLTSDNSTTFLNQATDITNSNPLLGPLQNNGGLTQTHALLPNSPALDKGNSTGIPLDQRGRTRPFDISGIAPATGGDNSDIGAFESQASIVRNDEIVAVPGSLRQVITDAPAGADILFDPAFFNVPRSIFVSGGEILINKNLTINGPGANLLTLSGANLNRVFAISGGVTVNLSNLTISNGKTTADGGGIVSAGNLTMTRCNIVNNTSGDGFGGGGVSVFGATGTFTECNFSGNKQGAVLMIGSSGTIINCTFNGNTTLLGGGAVQLVGSSVAITGCTMNGNTASIQGGAVSLGNASGTITNCTISGNTSPNGGGIAINATTGTATLAITSCTVANNTGTNNGGIFVQSTGTGTIAVTLRNTIIANNGSVNIGGSAAPGSFATITSQGFNLTNDLTNVSLNQPTDIVNANPQLGPLQNNGGLTQTHALLFGSRAIDKGSSSGVATDQRGVRRPVDDPLLTNAAGGDGADIGAFERTAPAVVSAASFKGSPLAQESIVALFGENLTGGIAIASTVPLPTTLDSSSVMVSDSTNTGRAASLFFVSPGQFNFQIPPGTAAGAATVSVLRNGNVIASASVTIAAVEPSLFTANASGQGAPAAVLFRLRNGVLTTESAAGQIDLGPEGDVTVLVLYGGGIRKRSSLSAVTIRIGGVNVAADFADAAPGFVGLDQINTAVLPRSLAGKGVVNLELTVDGKPANVVTLNFR